MPAPRVPLLALLHGDPVRGEPVADLLPRLPACSVEARIGAGEQRSLERVAPAVGRTGIRAKLQQLQDAIGVIDLGGHVQERIAHRVGAPDVGAGLDPQVELRVAAVLPRAEARTAARRVGEEWVVSVYCWGWP